MIKLYQIHLSDSEHLQLNREGWDTTNSKIRAYGMRSVVRPEEVQFEFYTHVANIDTDDKEVAFMLTNLWEEPERVTKVSQCYSMSVGDIVEMEDGSRWLCASFGFKQI